MKTYISLILTLAVAVQGFRYEPKVLSTRSSVETWGVHNAKVDNFDASNTATYEQRYLSNLEFAKAQDPPIIIYVAGEWEITEGGLGDGFQLYFIAKENEGALFNLEHRFYGKSLPKKDFATDNLKLLTIDQAQADLLGFISMLKLDPQFANSKVVLFGCSYSATLVTWAKHDHPDVIDMIYATSGPLHAQSDMYPYVDKASMVINLISSPCANLLKEASQQLVALFNEQDGAKKVRTLFNYCDPFKPNAALDKMVIFEDMAAYWSNNVQANINAVSRDCRTMLDDTQGTALEKYARLRREDGDCTPQDYNANLNTYKKVSPAYGSLRPFFYMQCTIFGWFVTTTNNTETPSLFFAENQVTTEYYHNLCKDAFGRTITQEDTEAAIAQTNDKYGGHTPDVTKAVFVYGGLDPWEAMGVHSNYSDSIVYHYVGSGGHCYDNFAPSANDDEYMRPVKVSVRSQLKQWLNE